VTFLSATEIDADEAGCTIARTGHLAPGFAIDFVGGTAPRAFRKEIELPMQFRHGDGHHIPQILGNDIDRNEIDFAHGVATAPPAALDHITVMDKVTGRFDLHSPELVAGIEDEIVALAISPGFGDTEAEAGSFGEEGGFGSFTPGLASREADGMKFGNVSDRKTS
jgi:hypothetical protein